MDVLITDIADCIVDGGSDTELNTLIEQYIDERSLGRTRQSVARLLTDWEAKGVVRLGYRRLRVLDAERLKAMADCP